MTLQKCVEYKLLLHVASVVFLLYFFFAIDRGNVGFASLEMNRSLGLTSEIFGFGSGLFTLAYLLMQVPNAELLRRLGASRGFALIGCAWGIVSTSAAFVPDPFWFLVNRFVLGVSEAGFHAFLIYYINQLFPARVRGFAVGLTFLAVPVSMIVASPLSGVLLGLELHGLHGWQSLFIIEGVPSVILGVLCLKLIPDTPDQASFLSEEERRWLEGELASAPAHRKERSSIWATLEGFSSPLVWGLGFVLFTMVLAVNVMTIWMPQIIRQVSGAGNVAVGLINSLPWLAFSVGCLIFSRISDKAKSRMTTLRVSVAVATVGFLLAAVFQQTHPVGAFCGFLLAGFGAGGAQVVFWALTMQLMSGPTAAAAFAAITVLGNGSGVFAHPLIGRVHDATGSFVAVVWTLAVFYVAAFVALQWIARGRAARGAEHQHAGPLESDASAE